jgi:hypothetical protein
MNELLQSVKNLPIKELEQFIQHVLILRAQRSANSLSAQESELLEYINRSIPTALQQRYDLLSEQQRQYCLSEDEHKELLKLIEQIEQFDLQRLKYLGKLAKLRKVSLKTVMQDLGIKAADYV